MIKVICIELFFQFKLRACSRFHGSIQTTNNTFTPSKTRNSAKTSIPTLPHTRKEKENKKKKQMHMQPCITEKKALILKQEVIFINATGNYNFVAINHKCLVNRIIKTILCSRCIDRI